MPNPDAETVFPVVAFSTKHDGDMSRTNGNRLDSMARRARFVSESGLEGSKLALIRPSHCPNIELLSVGPSSLTREVFFGDRIIDTDFDNYWDGSDGILTTDSGITVGLVSADCIPVVVWHPGTRLHGILHVGLLGALNNLVSGLPRAVGAVHISPGELQVRLGPSIDAKDYVVSTSGLWLAIEDQIERKLPSMAAYTARSGDKLFFDVRQLVVDQLLAAGIPRRSISVTPGSTAAPDSQYFSHHVDRVDGADSTRRFMSIVGWPS